MVILLHSAVLRPALQAISSWQTLKCVCRCVHLVCSWMRPHPSLVYLNAPKAHSQTPNEDTVLAAALQAFSLIMKVHIALTSAPTATMDMLTKRMRRTPDSV